MKLIDHKILKFILYFLFLFNVIDGLITLIFLNTKNAEELNPLMAWAFCKSAILFISIKIVWIGFNIFLIWLGRKEVREYVAWILFSLYACLIVYESVFFFMWLAN